VLYTADQRRREYRSDWDNFSVEQRFDFNDRSYTFGDVFVRAEAKADEHEVARLYRHGFIGKPVPPMSAKPSLAGRPLKGR
jgi:hypothetical protein